MKIKKDSFLNARGGKAKLIELFCMNCKNSLLKYQKDGSGQLHRCYLNRIIEPTEYQTYKNKPLKDIPPLKCKNCNFIIGIPMIYEDGRPAFRLIPMRHFKKLINI